MIQAWCDVKHMGTYFILFCFNLNLICLCCLVDLVLPYFLPSTIEDLSGWYFFQASFPITYTFKHLKRVSQRQPIKKWLDFMGIKYKKRSHLVLWEPCNQTVNLCPWPGGLWGESYCCPCPPIRCKGGGAFNEGNWTVRWPRDGQKPASQGEDGLLGQWRWPLPCHRGRIAHQKREPGSICRADSVSWIQYRPKLAPILHLLASDWLPLDPWEWDRSLGTGMCAVVVGTVIPAVGIKAMWAGFSVPKLRDISLSVKSIIRSL